MFSRGSLANRSHFTQLLSLLFLAFIGASLASFLGFLLVKPLFGIDAFNNSAALFNYELPAAVSALKLIQIVSSIGIFIIPVWYYGFLMDGNKEGIASNLRMQKMPIISLSVIVIVLMFCISPAIDLLTRFNELMKLPGFLSNVEQWMKTQEDQASTITKVFLQMDGINSLLVNLLMIGILPAIGEELIFRGALQRLFASWTKNPHLGIIIAAFIFSAIHIQFYGFLPRFALGVLLGYLFYWSNNLWLPILGHFINNGTAVIASFLAQRGFINYDMDEPAILPAYLIVISILLSFGGFYLFYNENKKLA